MAKLTRQQLKLHSQACELLEVTRDLNWDERRFVIENWRPTAADVTANDAFFTPLEIATHVAQDTMDEGHILDLCGGIGRLTFAIYEQQMVAGWRTPRVQVTVVEKNPEFVKVGRKILPEANWVEGDMLDVGLWRKLGCFDTVVSNPPFGSNSRDAGKWLKYHGPMSLMAIEIAMRVSENGTAEFILPQAQCPFRYSGVGAYQVQQPVSAAKNFMEMWPQIQWEVSNFTTDGAEFDDTPIQTEIVRLEWDFRHRKIEVPVEYQAQLQLLQQASL